MPAKRPAVSVLCRGTCTNGHVVEANSEVSRVTWTGPCPTCGEKTFARRATGAHSAGPRVVEPVTPEDPPPAAPAKKTSHSRVTVDEWSNPNDDPRPATRRRAAAARAKTGRAAKGAGSSPKPPGTGKRTGAASSAPAGGGDPASTGTGGGGPAQADPPATRPRGGRLRERAAAFARAGSSDEDDLFDGIF